MVDYFQVCMDMAGDDSEFIAKSLGVIARAMGITKTALLQALAGNGKPEFSIILKVINALGLRLKVV